MTIAILQNNADDGAGYLATWLQARALPFRVFRAYADEALPASTREFTGLAILGGPMSANDDLPSLRQTEALIRQCAAAQVPVVGHCLGGQLIAKALGASVRENAQPEIGWSTLHVASHSAAREWFATAAGASCPAFQWHYDTFDVPDNAELLASSEHCAHQAFAIHKMLAMQFHIEVDAAKVAHWANLGAAETAEHALFDSVQSSASFLAQAPQRLPQSLAIADQIYGRFVALQR